MFSILVLNQQGSEDYWGKVFVQTKALHPMMFFLHLIFSSSHLKSLNVHLLEKNRYCWLRRNPAITS